MPTRTNEHGQRERYCHKCQTWWLDSDDNFWRWNPYDTLSSPCKACIVERRREKAHSEPCCVPGCDRPRQNYYSRCQMHMRQLDKARRALRRRQHA